MADFAKRPEQRSAPPKALAAGATATRSDVREVEIPPVDALNTSEAVLAHMVDGLREQLVRTNLIQGRTQQVGARLPENLVSEAKRRTGLSSNTDLLIFALANVAIEDDFADAFERAHGKLDPGLDVGF